MHQRDIWITMKMHHSTVYLKQKYLNIIGEGEDKK